MNLEEGISVWIRRKVEEARAEGALVGLSGGLDSSVVAALAKKVLGEKILGLIMPCESDPLDEEYACLVAERFEVRTERVVLDSVYEGFLKILSRGGRLAMANLKTRLRMATLYYFANDLNYLVLGTGNKSEISVGYFTKYGDGGCDILPLGGLVKTEVRGLAVKLQIPHQIVERVPSAGLWGGQTDEGEMGLGYDDLDETISVIETGVEPLEKRSGEGRRLIERVKELMTNSRHKRAPIPIFKPSQN